MSNPCSKWRRAIASVQVTAPTPLSSRQSASHLAVLAGWSHRELVTEEKPVLVIGGAEGAAHGNVLSYPAQQLLGTHDRPFSCPAPGGQP